MVRRESNRSSESIARRTKPGWSISTSAISTRCSAALSRLTIGTRSSPGGATNRYAYADNDPVNKADANGHIALVDDAALAAAVLASMVAYDTAVDFSDDGQVNGTRGLGLAKSTMDIGRDIARGLENRSEGKLYDGPGSVGDWGSKGAHWTWTGQDGTIHVGIRPGEDDFDLVPALESDNRRGFKTAADKVRERLQELPGLKKLGDQVKGMLTNPKEMRGKKAELEELAKLIDKKIDEKSKEKSGGESGKPDQQKGKKGN